VVDHRVSHAAKAVLKNRLKKRLLSELPRLDSQDHPLDRDPNHKKSSNLKKTLKFFSNVPIMDLKANWGAQ
jgi:hypothetical protein